MSTRSDSALEMKIRTLSTFDELQELRAITEQCAAQAVIAKQQAAKYAQHYRISAEEFRKRAERSRFPEIQARLLRIAASNERLSNIVEGTDDKPEAQGQTQPLEPIELSPQGGAIKPVEDPVSQARRHVAEAELRIERQEALVARLADSNKYIILAAEAREILFTLRQTLRLARDHLVLELRK